MLSTETTSTGEVWGILGGMGPLASAEFLKTIYEETICGDEQKAPIILLHSDPTMPDRTETLLSGDGGVLLKRLTAGVGQLGAAGATRIVVCCVTIHGLIARVPAEWQGKIVSLVDLIYSTVLRSNSRHLLVCTNGARGMELFEHHRSWPDARDRIVFPSDEDQLRVHAMLYDLKRNRCGIREIELLEKMTNEYGVDSYIAGCTEVHILAKQQERLRHCSRRQFCIDPLTDVVDLISGRASAQRAFRVSAL